MDPYSSIDKLPPPPVSAGQLKWNKAKFIIRVICLIIEIIILGFEGHFLAQWAHHSPATRIYTQYSYVAVPFIALPIAWSLAELITVACRRSLRNGIAPGAHVGCELFVWIGLCAAGSIRLVGALNGSSYSYYDYPSPLSSFRSVMGLVVSGLMLFLSLIHFTLFTRACVEVDLQRRDKRVQEIIVAMQRMPQPHNPMSSETMAGSNSLAQPTPDLLSQDFVQKYNMLMMNWPDAFKGQDQPIPQDNQKVLLDDLLDARLKATRRKPTTPPQPETAESSEPLTSTSSPDQQSQ